MNKISKRQEKYGKLMSEVKYFKNDKALRIIADQLSWRMVMRIVNKLERIRSTDGITDAEKGLKVGRKSQNNQLSGQLDLLDIIDNETKEKKDE